MINFNNDKNTDQVDVRVDRESGSSFVQEGDIYKGNFDRWKVL